MAALLGILNGLKIQQRQKLLMNRLLSIESTSNGMRNKWLMLSRLSQMDHLAIRCAAEEYDVPRSTLGDRISGRVAPGSTSAPPKYLSTQEEEELVQFLIDCASIGFMALGFLCRISSHRYANRAILQSCLSIRYHKRLSAEVVWY